MDEEFFGPLDKFFNATKTNSNLAERVAAAKRDADKWQAEQRARYAPEAPDGTKTVWLANFHIKEAETLDEAVQRAKEKWAKECEKEYNASDWAKMEPAFVTGGIVMHGKVMSAEEWKVDEGQYSVAVYGSPPQKV